MAHICIAYLTIIASDNGLSPSRRQAIIWTNAGILLIRPLGTNFSEILIEIHTFSFKKMHLKKVICEKAAILSRPQCVKLTIDTLYLTLMGELWGVSYGVPIVKISEKIGTALQMTNV